MNPTITPGLKTLLEQAIEQLSDMQACAGCNDLLIENTDEMRQLWDEWNAWNLNTTIEEARKDEDQYVPFGTPRRDGKVCVNDSLLVFLLRRQCGLLTR